MNLKIVMLIIVTLNFVVIFFISENNNFVTGLLSKSESVKFSLIESAIWLFTDSSVTKSFSLLNQLFFTILLVKIIFSTVKTVTFHWSNKWNLTDLQ